MLRRIVLSLLLLGCQTQVFAQGNWPQWRGPGRDGQAAGTNWPGSLDERALKLRWRIELGPSYSSPIVSSTTVFTTETKSEKSEVVHAFDRLTGSELWRAEWEGAMKVPFFARSNGDWIRSTPALDGDLLFVGGMRDVVACLRASSGEVVWRRDFPQELGTELPAFGLVCSPLIDGDRLIIQAGGGVACLDKFTGKERWRSLEDGGGMNGSAFSSPVIGDLAGVRQLVVQSRTHLAGIRLEDGKVLWKQAVEAFRGMNILTPTLVGTNRVFTSSYGGKSTAFDVESVGSEYRVRQAWSMKSQGYMTSPVVIGGNAYLHLRSQRVQCLDLASGMERWTTSKSFGKYWSMVAQGDRILALDERGILYLLKANPTEPEFLAERKVADDAWAHLAVAGDQLFIRELRALAVYDWK